MRGIFTSLDEDRLVLVLSKEIYEREAVMRAAYKGTASCIVLVRPRGENEVEVVFEHKDAQNQADLRAISGLFCNELLDQQIRLDLEKRYGHIRHLIVEHAFSPLEDLKKALGET